MCAVDRNTVKLICDADLYVKRHEYFRWTPKTARIAFLYVIAVPSVVGYLFYKMDVSRSYENGIGGG